MIVTPNRLGLCLCACALGASAFSAQAQFTGFAPAQGYGTFEAPSDTILADLDGDGDLDIAATVNGPDTFDEIVVLINNGDGTFGGAVLYGVGGAPRGLAAADMDLDGDIDLLCANRGSADVSLLRNNGDGTFLAEVIIPAGTLPQDIAVADFNVDGKPDFVVTNGDDNSHVRVYLGDASGTNWVAPTIWTTNNGGGTGGAFPNSVIAKDLNFDGAPDIVTANQGSDTLTILYNTGIGSFFTGDFATFVTTGDNPSDLACADMNGDGAQDLVVVNRLDNSVSVHFNNSNGGAVAFPTFPTSSTTTTPSQPESVITADLGAEEGDGDQDLLITTFGNLRVRLNTGAGVFVDGGTFPFGSGSGEPAAGDLDGDGDIDAIVPSAGSSEIGVYLNQTIIIGGADPVARIDSPASFGLSGSCICQSGSDITGVADVPGGVFASYLLEYRPVSDPMGWVTIINSVDSVPDPGGVLGMMSVGGLGEGLYLIRLTVENSSGVSDTAEIVVWVSTDYDTLDWFLARGNLATGNVSSAEIVGGNACVYGTANDNNCGPDEYIVEYSVADANTWMLVDPGNPVFAGARINSLLADWDTTMVPDGAYDVRVVASNGCGDMKTFQQNGVVVDNIAPIAEITAPLNCDVFNPTGMLDFVGTAFDANIGSWSLSYTGGDENGWVTIASGTNNVVDDVIASWDISSLRPCAYTVRLRVTDKAIVNCNSGRSRSFYTSINVGCIADLAEPYNVLDFTDVLAFLASFGAGCP